MTPFPPEWAEWSGQPDDRDREDRFPLTRLLHFAPSAHVAEGGYGATGEREESIGFLINVSSGGLCVLTRWALVEGTILRIRVPLPVPRAEIPTLAEVRWVRELPDVLHQGYATGLRFVL